MLLVPSPTCCWWRVDSTFFSFCLALSVHFPHLSSWACSGPHPAPWIGSSLVVSSILDSCCTLCSCSALRKHTPLLSTSFFLSRLPCPVCRLLSSPFSPVLHAVHLSLLQATPAGLGFAFPFLPHASASAHASRALVVTALSCLSSPTVSASVSVTVPFRVSHGPPPIVLAPPLSPLPPAAWVL